MTAVLVGIPDWKGLRGSATSTRESSWTALGVAGFRLCVLVLVPVSDDQWLVSGMPTLLRAPVTPEDREFTLIVFSFHDLDPVRTRSILRRRSSTAMRA